MRFYLKNVLALVILAAALGKILHPVAAIDFLGNFSIGWDSASILVRVFSFIELTIALSIILGIFEKWMLGLLGILFCGFSIISLVAYVTIGSLECGCFGKMVTLRAGPISFVINLLLALLSFYTIKTIPAHYGRPETQ